MGVETGSIAVATDGSVWLSGDGGGADLGNQNLLATYGRDGGVFVTRVEPE